MAANEHGDQPTVSTPKLPGEPVDLGTDRRGWSIEAEPIGPRLPWAACSLT